MTGRYDQINLKLPRYRPKYISIEGKTGNIYQGRKGRYQILSIGKDTIRVLYLDGEWKDKEVTMSKLTHSVMQQNIPMERKILTDLKLDLWWERLPTIYEGEWHGNIDGQELLGILELKYPDQAEIINRILEMD